VLSESPSGDSPARAACAPARGAEAPIFRTNRLGVTVLGAVGNPVVESSVADTGQLSDRRVRGDIRSITAADARCVVSCNPGRTTAGGEVRGLLVERLGLQEKLTTGPRRTTCWKGALVSALVTPEDPAMKPLV